MKNIEGVWLTDNEQHLVPYLQKGKGTYQIKTLEQAVKNTPGRKLVVDVGAHVGLWSMHLAKQFDRVIGVEPVPQHRECFARNVPYPNVELLPFALGEETKTVTLDWDPTNTGHTHVGKGTLSVPMKRLDDLKLTGVDLIKIDCEGYELYVLRGGRKMLLRERPIICIEQKPHGYYGQDKMVGVKYLESLGAVIVDKVNDDYILGWSDRLPEPEPEPTISQQIQAFWQNMYGKLTGKSRAA